MENTKFDKYYQAFLATIIVSSILAYYFLMTFTDNAVIDSIKTVNPSFTTIFGIVIGYYFGSSSSAKAKDSTIDKLSQNQPKP